MNTEKRNRIVVTGMGAVTPLGTGVTRYWENLIAGKCGIDRIAAFDASELAVQIAGEVRDFRPEDHMPGKLIHETDAFTQYAFAAAGEALADAMQGVRARPGGEEEPSGHLPAAPNRCGIVMGTAMSGIDTIAATQEILTNAVHKNVGPRFVPRILGNIAAGQIAIHHGMTGPSFTISTACASGGDAILMGAMQLLAGEADMMLAVGADSTLCPLVIYSLSNARALSRENEQPHLACRPFDRGARGFVMGEGGGALVLETEDHARARGARIYAELAGWANNNDAYHVTRPAEEGAQAAACMERALQRAGLTAADIGFINAHGTGTRSGDLAEVRALERVFGAEGPSATRPGADTAAFHAAITRDAPVWDGRGPAISATKAATGHMMGGGGITEAIACIQAIRTASLPPTLNLEDPIADLDFVTERRDGQDIEAAMTNAFGFGGQNSCLIFRRFE